MAVILYAGGFASFFLGEWRQGLVFPSDEHDETADLDSDSEEEGEEATPAEVCAYFEHVRGILTSSLQPMTTGTLTWSEDLSQGFDTVFSSATDIGSLMLIVARSHAGKKRMPPIVKGRPWHEDPAVEELQDAEHDFQTVHHLVKADTWLPGDFAVVLAAEVPERTLLIGSLPRLTKALADAAVLLQPGSEAIRKLPAEFVSGARRAHAAFTRVATFSAANGSPMLIDSASA